MSFEDHRWMSCPILIPIPILLLAALSACDAADDGGPPPAEVPSLEIIDAYYQANESLDAEAFAAAFAEDGVWNDQAGFGAVVGRDAIREQFAASGTQIAGGHMDYPVLHGFGDRVLVEWTFDLTGRLPPDAPPDAEPGTAQWTGLTAFRLTTEGSIAESRVFWDAAHEIAELAGVEGPLPGLPLNHHEGTEAVRAAVDDFFAAWNAGDPDAMAGEFAADGVFDRDDDRPPAMGSASIAEAVERMLSAEPTSGPVEYAVPYSFQRFALASWSGPGAQGYAIFELDDDGAALREVIVFGPADR